LHIVVHIVSCSAGYSVILAPMGDLVRVVPSLYHRVPSRRGALGDAPRRRLTWWARWLEFEKPTARATSARAGLASESRLLARSTRRWMRYWCGVSPVAP